MVLKKTLGSFLDCKEIKPGNSKRNQCWIFIGRTGAEAPIFWPPDAKNPLTKKDPNAGNDWRQKKRAWTCVWANSRRQWRIERFGVLQSIGLQRVKYDLATEQEQLLAFCGCTCVVTKNVPVLENSQLTSTQVSLFRIRLYDYYKLQWRADVEGVENNSWPIMIFAFSIFNSSQSRGIYLVFGGKKKFCISAHEMKW